MFEPGTIQNQNSIYVQNIYFYTTLKILINFFDNPIVSNEFQLTKIGIGLNIKPTRLVIARLVNILAQLGSARYTNESAN